MKRIRLFALLAACLLAVSVSAGCQSSAPVLLRYDLPAAPRSLDPQFADPDSTQEQLLLANLFAGLVRPTKEGGVEGACAARWSISPDGLVYTFTMREGLVWSDGSALTAEDFAFGLRRLFLPPNPAESAAFYRDIANAEAVMAGEAPAEALGVSAPDARTLVISLGTPNAQFLTLLARPAAAPCSRAFFEQQKGRYGLERRMLLTNGPFLLSAWSDSAVRLRKNERFFAPAAIDGVDFAIRADAEARFLAGETDACLFGGDAAMRAMPENGGSGEWIRGRSWALLLNPTSDLWRDEALRRALIGAVDPDALAARLEAPAVPAQGLISPAFSIGGLAYREAVGPTRPPSLSGDARAQWLAALERLGLSRLPKTTLLICGDSAGDRIGAALLQRWSDTLSAYINLETAEPDALLSRVRAGRFDLALAPLPTDAGDRTGGLRLFSELSGGELLPVSPGGDARTQARLLYEAEQAAIDSCLALPVYEVPSLFCLREGVEGVWCERDAPIVHFSDAQIR